MNRFSIAAFATLAFVIAYGYILQAPLGVLTAPLRERFLGAESVAPRRERMPSVFLPDNDWVRQGQVVLSTDPDQKVGTPVEAGEELTIGPRCVVVLQEV